MSRLCDGPSAFTSFEAEIFFDDQADVDAAGDCTAGARLHGRGASGLGHRRSCNGVADGADDRRRRAGFRRARERNDQAADGGELWAWGKGWTRNKYATGCANADQQVLREEPDPRHSDGATPTTQHHTPLSSNPSPPSPLYFLLNTLFTPFLLLFISNFPS